jgi:hypothetical protein
MGIVLLSMPAPAGAHAGATTCSFDSRTVHLRLASEHVVQLYAYEGRIHFADLTNYAHKGQCGTATVTNTDSVRVTEEVAGRTRLELAQHLGAFGPGRLAESSGISEIEVNLGTLTDVWLLGRAVRDAVVIGTRGVDFNGDGDADLIGSNLAEITAFLDDGDDLIDASGSPGTGDPWSPPASGYLLGYGGDGDDILRGTGRRDVLAGDAGDDRIAGRGGGDDLRGGSNNDFLSGGGGDDIIDPGPWPDTVNAGPGNDYITAADYGPDTVAGGTGTDRAIVDREDTLTSIESASLGP